MLGIYLAVSGLVQGMALLSGSERGSYNKVGVEAPAGNRRWSWQQRNGSA